MADVFISYSRKDAGFVQALQAALEDAGRVTWVDLADIAPSADWLAEIHAAIDEADAFLFILSPDSVTSRTCADELAYAEQHQKRLIPVVRRNVPVAAVPPGLQPLNWLFYRETDDGAAAFVALLQALDTDLVWVKVHTRLLTQALDWERHACSRSYLLRGESLHAVEEALAKVGSERRPQPTPLQRAYVLAGRRSASQTQQRMLGAVGVAALILAIVAAFALVQRQEAVRQRHQADVQRNEADAQRTEAVHQQQVATSRERAASALGQLTSDPERSLLLALEALKAADTPEAEDALRQAFVESRMRTVFRGHTGYILEVHASPDWRDVVSTGADGVVRVWDRETGVTVAELPGQEASVYATTFSRDGRSVLTASKDGTVRAWEWRVGQTTRVLSEDSSDISGAQFNQNGTLLATARASGVVRVLDVSTDDRATLVSELAHTGDNGRSLTVNDISFSSDGRFLATAVDDGTAWVWETGNGQKRAVVRGHSSLTGTAFNPGGTALLTYGVNDFVAHVWDWRTGKELGHITSHGTGTAQAVYSADGRFIVSAGADGSTSVWIAATGREAFLLRGHTGVVITVTISPDNRWIVTGSADATARVWAGPAEAINRILGADRRLASSAAVSHDGKYVVTGDIDGAVRVWDIGSGALLTEVPTHKRYLSRVAFSPDDARVATASFDGMVEIWNWRSGTEIVTFPIPSVIAGLVPGFMARQDPQPVSALAFSPDGNYVVTARTYLPGIWVWDARTGQVTASLNREWEAFGADFSPDGKLVVTGSENGAVRIWDAATGDLVTTLSGPVLPILSVAFSPDGNHIVAGGNDTVVYVWERSTSTPILTLRGHTGRVYGVGFSPDGRWVVSSSDDGSVRVWEAQTGRRVAELWGGGGLGFPAFSPNGAFVVTTSDRTVQLNGCEACVSLDQLAALARSHLTRELICSERRIYLHDTACLEQQTHP